MAAQVEGVPRGGEDIHQSAARRRGGGAIGERGITRLRSRDSRIRPCDVGGAVRRDKKISEVKLTRGQGI